MTTKQSLHNQRIEMTQLHPYCCVKNNFIEIDLMTFRSQN